MGLAKLCSVYKFYKKCIFYVLICVCGFKNVLNLIMFLTDGSNLSQIVFFLSGIYFIYFLWTLEWRKWVIFYIFTTLYDGDPNKKVAGFNIKKYIFPSEKHVLENIIALDSSLPYFILGIRIPEFTENVFFILLLSFWQNVTLILESYYQKRRVVVRFSNLRPKIFLHFQLESFPNDPTRRAG